VAKQVTCDSCRRSFLVPEEIGDFWVLCPFCEKVNPRAQQDIQKALPAKSTNDTWTIYGLVGTLLLIAGILGGIFGTILVFIGANFNFAKGWIWETDFRGVLLSGIWLIASVALFVAGALLMQADEKGGMAEVSWRTAGGVLMALIAGIGGWVFVFETCKL
jgi:hypothetical protein